MPGRYVVYPSPTLVCEFEMDRRGIAQVAMGADLRREVNKIAAKALPYAVQASPYYSGQYARSWKLDVGGSTVVAAMRRVAARLVNTDPAAAAIEWGNRYGDPAHHTMRAVLEHISEGHIDSVA